VLLDAIAHLSDTTYHTAACGANQPAPPVYVHIDAVAWAYFTDMVAGRSREVYDLLAPCAATIHVGQGMIGLPARGPYQPNAPCVYARPRFARCAWSRVACSRARA